MTASLETDVRPTWVEPFAALYWRIRMRDYLLGLALLVICCMGFWLYRAAALASAHVYEVHPDGKALYIGEREANLAPRESEARFVAKQFVQLVYGWNSSTVHQDLAQAIAMCAPAMAEQFRRELADALFVDTIRRRGIRSEVSFDGVEVVEHSRTQSRVRLVGKVQVFAIAQYEGAPSDVRTFSTVLVLAAVPRDPDLRPNGLEVVRIVQDQPVAANQEAQHVVR